MILSYGSASRSEFSTQGTTNDKTKYSHFIVSLSPEVAQEVHQIDGPHINLYNLPWPVVQLEIVLDATALLEQYLIKFVKLSYFL
ncbi:hypothetical protein HOLleu_19062 [Holothuria leucospilota]|uniref:Uncharacterized protein n=1 Tax=Holothuria leucospilota TaxID=206669 RepID=A0A9Q1HAD3_HOLLE|nr:hypothetical protein HOLleu_19062 [Holothuria leucospilota]